MTSPFLSRRHFIARTGAATAGSAALFLLQKAGAATGPDDGRGMASLPSDPPKVTLHWDEGPGNATGFLFEWGEDGVTFPNVVTIAGRLTSSEISFPRPGTYYGRLKAFNEAGTSPPGQTLIIPVNS